MQGPPSALPVKSWKFKEADIFFFYLEMTLKHKK